MLNRSVTSVSAVSTPAYRRLVACHEPHDRARNEAGRVNFKAFAGLESSMRMADQYDAVLYLGPVASITMAEMSPVLAQTRPT
jgi:hypothetical protein